MGSILMGFESKRPYVHVCVSGYVLSSPFVTRCH